MLAEEFGWAGVAVTLALYLCVIARCLWIASEARDGLFHRDHSNPLILDDQPENEENQGQSQQAARDQTRQSKLRCEAGSKAVQTKEERPGPEQEGGGWDEGGLGLDHGECED